ncbi:hypothetical protein M405DRAFT_938059, partial [Rhizopogon salebrosus TDB-379]
LPLNIIRGVPCWRCWKQWALATRHPPSFTCRKSRPRSLKYFNPHLVVLAEYYPRNSYSTDQNSEQHPT